MTSKIDFEDIIRTIRVFLNFHPDTFPIILSFENHCTIPYQVVMAELLVRILGDKLYIPTENSLTGNLPSPAELRGRVVIKGRRPDLTTFKDESFKDDCDITEAMDTYESEEESDEDCDEDPSVEAASLPEINFSGPPPSGPSIANVINTTPAGYEVTPKGPTTLVFHPIY